MSTRFCCFFVTLLAVPFSELPCQVEAALDETPAEFSDHSEDTQGHATCADTLGPGHPKELPGNVTTIPSGKPPAVFLSRTSWKPVTMLSVESTEDGPLFRSTQFGYTTLIGENGFPQYYQLDHVLLTRPKHTVDQRNYDFELQVASFRQNTVWDFDLQDMVVTSFFFQVQEDEEEAVDASSSLLQQVLDAHNHHENKITERAGVDLQRAMGPQLKDDFYVYTTSNDHCASAHWYVFTKPIAMSLAQKEELESIYPSLIPPNATHAAGEREPAVSMKNTFDEGVLAEYDFYLDRDTGRNRRQTGEYLILLPIIGTILLASAVMSSLFVTDKVGSASGMGKEVGDFGLSPSVIGSSSNYP